MLLSLILIIIGILLIFLGVRRREERSVKKVKKDVKAGGVILIGPFPIVFGESKLALYALILAILVISLILLLSVSL